MHRTRLLGLVVVFLLLLAAQPVNAHGYIVRAIPEDRASLERPPTRLQYWFSEALEREFSELNVRDQNGEIIAQGGVDEDDNTLMSVRLSSDLPEGAYIVELRPAFASDGHVVAESRVFFVGDEVGEVAGQAASDQAVPLEVVWRVIVLSSSLLLFGVFTLYALVLVPAWGNRDHRAGLLPPRVIKRLNVIIGFSLLAVFAGNLLALIQQTMVFFNIGFTAALDPNFWSLVRIGSRFGDIWNARIVFLGVVGMTYLLVFYLRREQPRTVRAFLTANAWVMALVLGSSSVLSHAAGSLLWPWVGIGVDWLHILAVGFWVGGAAALALVLPVALRPYEGETRRQALLPVLRRFTRVATAALVVVIATGIYSASNWIYGPEEAASSFGLSLAIKIGLVALLVSFGALHHIALRPERYARFRAITRRVGDFIPTLRLEMVAALLALFGASLLSATPVPVPEFAQREVEAPSASLTLGDLEITQSILPGGPGINTYDTLVLHNGERADNVDVQVRTLRPAEDERSDWQQAEPIEPGLYATTKDDINAEGEWWTLVDVTGPDGEQHRAAFSWQISDEAAVIESIDPNVFNILALVGVLFALGWVVYPPVQRFYTNVLEVNTFTVSVVIGTLVATVGALVVAYVVIQQTRENYAATLNPPPQVVNIVLPTQHSLERGEALFELHCADAWNDESRDYNDLIRRLNRTRDDELYNAFQQGWRDLPACAANLETEQRWHLVNYFRTFEELVS